MQSTEVVMDVRIIIKINELITRGTSGTPKHLADFLGISERAVYKYLKYMREDLYAPIEYSKHRSAYVYAEEGGFNFLWNTKNTESIQYQK